MEGRGGDVQTPAIVLCYTQGRHNGGAAEIESFGAEDALDIHIARDGQRGENGEAALDLDGGEEDALANRAESLRKKCGGRDRESSTHGNIGQRTERPADRESGGKVGGATDGQVTNRAQVTGDCESGSSADRTDKERRGGNLQRAARSNRRKSGDRISNV